MTVRVYDVLLRRWRALIPDVDSVGQVLLGRAQPWRWGDGLAGGAWLIVVPNMDSAALYSPAALCSCVFSLQFTHCVPYKKGDNTFG